MNLTGRAAVSVLTSALAFAALPAGAPYATAQLSAEVTLPEVHIDQRCQMLSATGLAVAGTPAIDHAKEFCRLESVKMTQHQETEIINNNPHRVLATVAEQDYLLQNNTAEPLVFVIQHHIPRGWHVDSEPEPNSITDSTATFRAIAQPGQTVRLHVGMKTTLLGPLPRPAPVVLGAPDIEQLGVSR